MIVATQKRLSELLKDLIQVPAALDCWIADLQSDSRQVCQGSLFIGAEGIQSDGADYCLDARSRGAIALLIPGQTNQVYEAHNVIIVELETVKPHVGEIAHRFFGEVTRDMKVIGVTGTNGKSSVTHFIAQLAQLAGVKAAVIGTLGYGSPNDLQPTDNTTPDAVSLHRYLAELYRQGFQSVALEVSSHALDQYRVAGIVFASGVFTNLSRDHLDYHGSMKCYAAAKKKLFTHSGAPPVLNLGDATGRQWAQEFARNDDKAWLGFALEKHEQAALWVDHLRFHAGGVSFSLCSHGFKHGCHIDLPGSFNLENVVAALTGLLSMGYPLADLVKNLEKLKPVAGRMERLVGGANSPTVIIDYAHTPDALQAALRALKGFCTGQLWCVFGCGGDRDRGKRGLMGQAADDWADHIVLTDDNPRNEEPAGILADIMSGIVTRDKVIILQPRERAIAMALQQARADDIVLIAGKGHEDYQEIKGHRHWCSDRVIATKQLQDGIGNTEPDLKLAGSWR